MMATFCERAFKAGYEIGSRNKFRIRCKFSAFLRSQFRTLLQGTVGPVDLAGEKSGHQFSAIIHNHWEFYNPDNNRDVPIETLEQLIDSGGWDPKISVIFLKII